MSRVTRKNALLHSVIDRLYRGALEEDAWISALEGIHSHFGAEGMALFSINPKTLSAYRAEVMHVDHRTITDYHETWIQQDPRHSAGNALKDGEVVTEEDLVRWGDFTRTTIYNEFLVPSNITRQLATWVQRTDERGVVLSLARGRTRSAFSKDLKKDMAVLVPHLRRAIEVKDRLCAYRAVQQSMLESLDRFPFAVILLRRDLTIDQCSTSAQQLLSEGTSLRSEHGRLRILPLTAERRFHQQLDELTRREGEMPVITVPRGPERVPLSLLALPLYAERAVWVGSLARWMLLVHVPEMTSCVPPERLQRALGATPAEAALVYQLLQGKTLTDAAAELRISVHTARSQLKALFAKTGVSRQSELIRHVLCNPLLVR
jgi:DNA-binding CsgD family transcriptional regulator